MTTNNELKIGKQKTCSEIAKRLGVTRAAVSNWKKRGRVPAARVHEFCQVTGMKPEAANPIFKDFV